MSKKIKRDYTSLYQIKEFMVNEVAPKYLDVENMNMASTGLFGYITELLSTVAEDGMNATSMVFKECFANAAENPESLYLMAAIYQLENLFATPASMPFVLLIGEDDIINKGKDTSGIINYYVDSDTVVTVEGREFILEYDLKISAKKTANGYVYTVIYMVDHVNALAKSGTQYVKSKVFRYEGQNYLAMQVNLRQMKRTERTETIISNDVLSVCSFDYNMGEKAKIAGFEAFYTPPNGVEVQLTKRMENTAKVDGPFCFYTMPDEGILRITFSNDERYFVPEFNSTLRVQIYTTDGTLGNFTKYNGDEISIVPSDKKYPENKGTIMVGQVADSSIGGKDNIGIDELRNAVITAQSTVKAYSTANDLQLYFKQLSDCGNIRVMFMKRRDDALIRLFNAFVLLVDDNKTVLPTNTVDAILELGEIDKAQKDNERAIVEAGRLFKYSEVPSEVWKVVPDKLHKISDDLDDTEKDFIYTNPFLMVLSTNPLNVGLYLNSVNDEIYLEAIDVNRDSFVQFIISSLGMERNALLGEDEYEVRIKLLPTTAIIGETLTLVTQDTRITPDMHVIHSSFLNKDFIDNDRIRAIFAIEENGVETAYANFELYDFDGDYYYFKTKIKTNDFIASNGKLAITKGLYDFATLHEYPEKYIKPNDLRVNVYTFFKYPNAADNEPHKYTGKNLHKGYTLTNYYAAVNKNVSFVIPLSSINATVIYEPYIDTQGKSTVRFKIYSVPMVKANYLKDRDRFTTFMNLFNGIYAYLNAGMELLTNNFDIDIKFYNTYGKSKNYEVDEFGRMLDKVNIKLKLRIKPFYTTDGDTLLRDVKEFILEYVRGEFDSNGNNSIYISNIIKKLEVHFEDKIEYILYRGINDFDLAIQMLEPRITELNIQNYYSSMMEYVPEYINIDNLIEKNELTPQIQITII